MSCSVSALTLCVVVDSITEVSQDLAAFPKLDLRDCMQLWQGMLALCREQKPHMHNLKEITPCGRKKGPS